MAAAQTDESSTMEITVSYKKKLNKITFDPSVWTSQDDGSKVLLQILQGLIDPTLPASSESKFVVLGLGLYDEWNEALDIIDNLTYSCVYAKKKSGGRPKTLMQNSKDIVNVGEPGYRSLLDGSLVLADPPECDAQFPDPQIEPRGLVATGAPHRYDWALLCVGVEQEAIATDEQQALKHKEKIYFPVKYLRHTGAQATSLCGETRGEIGLDKVEPKTFYMNESKKQEYGKENEEKEKEKVLHYHRVYYDTSTTPHRSWWSEEDSNEEVHNINLLANGVVSHIKAEERRVDGKYSLIGERERKRIKYETLRRFYCAIVLSLVIGIVVGVVIGIVFAVAFIA